MKTETTAQIAYRYGKAVAARERVAHFASNDTWAGHQRYCKELWVLLRERGAYADTEGAILKPEYRQPYYDGLYNENTGDWE